MSTTSGNKDLPDANAQRSTNLRALIHRWHEGLTGIRVSLLSAARRDRNSDRRDRRASERVAERAPTPAPDESPEPIASSPLTRDRDTEERELVPFPDERSQALTALCQRLLQALDGEEVRAAEIRFVVHKHEREHPSYPRLDPESAAGGGGELVWELRRLIAWSGGTLADVARALETRGADLDDNARELLRDELAALDIDLDSLNVHLAAPIDWDTELEYLLAGEVAPFDDPFGDEDDENDH
jgi:hypothetical protein